MDININDIKKEGIKTLPQNIIRLCHNEYIRRWQRDNKEKVNSYQREHYKKYKKNHNNINDNHNNSMIDKNDIKKKSNDIKKLNPLDFNRL